MDLGTEAEAEAEADEKGETTGALLTTYFKHSNLFVIFVNYFSF